MIPPWNGERSLWKIKSEPVFCSVTLKGKPSKSDFPEGLHKLSYTVFDRAGNKATCRFTVRVRGEPLKAELDFNLKAFYWQDKTFTLNTSMCFMVNNNKFYQLNLSLWQRSPCRAAKKKYIICIFIYFVISFKMIFFTDQILLVKHIYRIKRLETSVRVSYCKG